jgi:hypothetical protein
MVDVAQLAERQVVILEVEGSIPFIHPHESGATADGYFNHSDKVEILVRIQAAQHWAVV